MGSAVRALLGGPAALGAVLVFALVSPRGLGMGDVKLAGVVGIGLGYLSWTDLLVGALVAVLSPAVVAVALLLTRARGWRDQIPFGPALAVGAITATLIP